jgi:dihydroorotate dehydrogenase (NAD+) catalytic subunit
MGNLDETDISAVISGLSLNPAILIPSGILSYGYILNEMYGLAGGCILKTTGKGERQGNETPVFCEVSEGTYINAVGLPDPGYEECVKELEAENSDYPSGHDLPVIASVSGESEEEIAEVVKALDPYVDAFEGNYSCPNIREGERIGVTIGYDRERVRDYSAAIRESTSKPVFAKLAPALYIFNRDDFLFVADSALADCDGLSAINTVPGGMKIDINAKHPVLSEKYGGVSGRGIKPIGVGCIYALREAFPGTPIIGLGGIETARDIAEYVQAGADAVAIGSALAGKTIEQKRDFLEKLGLDMKFIVRKLGYDSLMDMRDAAHEKK